MKAAFRAKQRDTDRWGSILIATANRSAIAEANGICQGRSGSAARRRRPNPPDYQFRRPPRPRPGDTQNCAGNRAPAEKVPHEGIMRRLPTPRARRRRRKNLTSRSAASAIYEQSRRQAAMEPRSGPHEHSARRGEAVTPVSMAIPLLLTGIRKPTRHSICSTRKTGKTKWTTPRVTRPRGIRHSHRAQGTTQVIVNGTKRVRSYDLRIPLIWGVAA